MSRRTSTLAVAALALTVAGCGGGSGSSDGSASSSKSSSSGESSKAPQSKVSVSSNIKAGATGVPVSKLLRLTASEGTFRTVQLATLKGVEVPGQMNADRTGWHATSRLTSGKKYVVKAVAADASGTARTWTARFDAASLTKDEQTYPSVNPLPDANVGVGMPIMVHFDRPVKNKAAFERNMHVTTSAGQTGSWYWIDDNTAHYRPQTYWQGGSTVNVDLDLASVDAGNGIYGQVDRKYSFKVGRSQVLKVSATTHQMKVIRDGKQIRQIPITTGMAGFTTRSGTKVIVEKDLSHDMNSETIGIDPNGPLGYNLKGVKYAMRLTFSGEFIHAAPWSVSSQGHANVSHGCTGLSNENAAWLFNNSMIGDPVEYTGTDKPMTLTNGYGDWNMSWADWQQGSALT
ncbi:L,D-transpeptidase [Nocardioides mangrovicus]|nr:Ig-like domain-containing protein [Nocardioides mangrovicus]